MASYFWSAMVEVKKVMGLSEYSLSRDSAFSFRGALSPNSTKQTVFEFLQTLSKLALLSGSMALAEVVFLPFSTAHSWKK